MPSYTSRSFGRSARSSSFSRKPQFGGSRSGGNRTNRRGPKKDYIHPSRFIAAAKPLEQVDYATTHQFSDFPVAEIIKTNLKNKGFVTPSPIQDQTVPLGLMGKDVIGIANTGTGKTAAFAIPVLDSLMHVKGSRALIIAPTRELAQQIQDECRSIGKGSGLFGTLLIGGSPMGPQLRDLKEKPEIVIGTPGRIKDHLERGTLQLHQFSYVVLDEVDRMLDMGFITDVTTILSQLAEKRQSFFFSATMDPKVNSLISTFSNDPVTVSVKTNETSENVDQNIVTLRSGDHKIDKLHDILLQDAVEKVIVFDDTQRSVEKLSDELITRGFSADAIHGGKSQGQRQRALNRFKKSEIKILVATDVAARGIDVADITHVINYSTPQSYQDYVHRIGRAGRAGRTGYALTFIED
jgi:ATP-dependent RNA helicase RhlE